MRIMLIAIAWMFSTAAAAQPTVFVSPPPMVVGQPQSTMLLTGTSIPLRLTQELTTKGKKLKAGDRFNLEVSEAISLNGVTVIPVGSLAVGEITTVRNKGMFGKSGLIEARVMYVRANGRQIRLTGRFDDKGIAGGVGAGVAAAYTLVGGFLITGTSARIPAGTQVMSYLDEDMPVTFAPGVASSRPMVVPAQ